jgi:two-component system alkaline phosphatase synthesis response regulator PhoP
MKILICEDEEILLTALEFRMRKAGFEVVIAKDGRAALEAIQQGDVDLVITDIETPELTALQLLEIVNEEDKLTVPIIVISDLSYEEEIKKALTMGAKDFVIKPFKPAELVLRTRCILEDVKMTTN